MKSDMSFKDYAEYYDLIYKDKDYEKGYVSAFEFGIKRRGDKICL